MRVKFISKYPYKGLAILMTDEGEEVKRFDCYAHTERGRGETVRIIENYLSKSGVPLEKQNLKFTITKE